MTDFILEKDATANMYIHNAQISTQMNIKQIWEENTPIVLFLFLFV